MLEREGLHWKDGLATTMTTCWTQKEYQEEINCVALANGKQRIHKREVTDKKSDGPKLIIVICLTGLGDDGRVWMSQWGR